MRCGGGRRRSRGRIAGSRPCASVWGRVRRPSWSGPGPEWRLSQTQVGGSSPPPTQHVSSWAALSRSHPVVVFADHPLGDDLDWNAAHELVQNLVERGARHLVVLQLSIRVSLYGHALVHSVL